MPGANSPTAHRRGGLWVFVNECGNNPSKCGIVDDNIDATNHYFKGKGKTAIFGPNVRQLYLDKSKELLGPHRGGKYDNIFTGYPYRFDMSEIFLDDSAILPTTTCNIDTCRTSFSVNDGFWDVTLLDGFPGDGLGSLYEVWGGTPYRFEHSWQETFPNPYTH
ncbi:MAG: hypothetical protein R1F54_00345 [Candidatus Zeuxoniibacter abyssi]|nr:MAG: hypothetical protein R1F54_00345 [Candidatus Persebacteraceae bacterium AB1(2)]